MYAKVLIQYGVKELDKTFTYHIPDDLVDELDIGMKVYVPFGAQNINGFVLEIIDKVEDGNYEIKDIHSIVTKELKLNDELMQLGHFIKEKTLCSLITAYQCMLPSALKVNNSKESYAKKIRYVKLNKSINEIEEFMIHNRRSKKQIEILELLMGGDVLRSELTGTSLNKLEELGLVVSYDVDQYRINPIDSGDERKVLTDEQTDAYNLIKDSFDKEKTFLLHGVTGSGKTEIYMQLCEDIIKANKNVIMLVPEISLTTQIVGRFYDRFGGKVAIFHSNLSNGEKYDEYKKIMNGEVNIVVGTRSAIFAPLTNIGLIIIDEEHSQNYKQDNNPRYHALDIAKWRSKYYNCPIVLGSATPSLESMARALKGVYQYIELKKRIGSAKLPSIKLIDMAPEFKKRNMILSDELQCKIMECLERKEQVMLLLNRRGYSTTITCSSCGYTYKCPHCDITLTYHKSSNNLRCHYCGYTTFNSEFCPECKEKAVRDFGLGTEKVEQFIRELYPSYNVVRMDLDTTTRKGEHERIIRAIENHEYDIIIGTQMISKGFDFPRVTLVGIINADESLNIPDFRSGENTFSLLSQVSGRAGRGELPGSVIIQTFNPDNKTLGYVINNDYLGNYNYEMEIRKTLKYPPYYYLVSLKVVSKKYESASKEASKVANYIRKHIGDNSICLGPTTASVFKINNVYRFQIILKYKKDEKLLETLKYLDLEYANNREVSLEIDIDPLRI